MKVTIQNYFMDKFQLGIKVFVKVSNKYVGIKQNGAPCVGGTKYKESTLLLASVPKVTRCLRPAQISASFMSNIPGTRS